jgi:YYY domain-containing protein
MFELLQMWALVEVLGFLSLPLTVTVFHNVADRGYALSKAVGVALLAFCVWLPLMYLHFLPFSRLCILSVALVVLALNLVGFTRTWRSIVKVVRVNVSYIVLTEAVFLGMVFLLGYLRSYLPDIRSFEMFMDEGFLAAIMRSQHFPPNDMWFSDYALNYYYYAHFTIATLAKLLGQSPSIAFNTGICLFFGLTAVNLFGVTCNILAWARYLRSCVRTGAIVERPDKVHPSLLPVVPYGLLTFVMALILGNLAATQQWWTVHGDIAHYDWFAPSRVIDRTINEFPAFSFLLSCFHAHVLALAFTILALGLAFNLFLEPDGKGFFVYGHGWRLILTLGTTALVLGSLFTMNGWDFPTYVGIALVCIALQQWLAYGSRFSVALALDIFLAGASLVALSFLLYIPFYLNFVSPSQGLGVVGAADRSPLANEILIYGLFAFVFISLLLASVSKGPLFALSKVEANTRAPKWSMRIVVLSMLLFAVLWLAVLLFVPNSATLLVASGIVLLAVAVLFYTIGDRSHAFTLLLGAVAFALVAGCEVFFLKDVFVDNYPRMNTIFKFYFQAWALLSIASGAGLYFIVESFQPLSTATTSQRLLQRGVEGIWGIGLLMLLLAGMVYPLVAPYTRYERLNVQTHRYDWQRTNSLDGMTYLQSTPSSAGDYQAIRWLNTHVSGDPVIVEANGPDYSDYGRISVFTGLPSPMNWVGHEYQWRVNWLNIGTNADEFGRRKNDVDTIYTDTDPTVVLAVMAHYKAHYLYIGPLEYQTYPAANLHRFSTFMHIVYNANGVTIYAVG